VNRSAEQLRSLYRTCAYYVQPGEEDFGIAAVEALACGAPVVALGRGGVRDIVADGVNGVLYEPADPGGLADALDRASRIEFDYTALRASALPFRTERFREEFKNEVESLLREKAESRKLTADS
jgi:glycosyltransferase involved in cell wall biosynthesis